MFSVQYKLEFEKIYLGKDNTCSKIKINKKNKRRTYGKTSHEMRHEISLKHRNLILKCQW